MILGILSDTHGRARVAARAVALLRELRAETFIHCGDVGGEAVFDALCGLRAWFVWGNCDRPDEPLRAYVARIGLPLPESVPLRVELAGRRIVVFHGHEQEFAAFERAAAADDADALRADYVLHGHTHVRRDERLGGVRFINPGALHRALEHTVATLDLAADALRFHRLGRDD